MLRLPDKPTSPAEWAIITSLGVVGFFGAGIFAIVVALRAPEEKQAQAEQAMQAGFVLIGIALLIAFLFWLSRRVF